MTIPKEIFDAMAIHSVMVNEGSGVLMQPASEEYCYVLTAKHVVEGKAIEQIDITDVKDEKITPIEVYYHSDHGLDAAIIKVEWQDKLKISAYSDPDNNPKKLMLRGFPGKVREQEKPCNDQLNSYDLEIINTSKNYWEYRNKSYAPHDDMEGCSGGGVFYLEQKNFDCEVYLAGVEFEVADHADGMGHQHLGCIPISIFHEIIEVNQLAKLKPLYLSDFKYSQAHIFHPYDLSNPTSLDGVRAVLLGIIQERILPSQTSPVEILAKFTDKLLAYRQVQRDLEEARLWVWFLEFLVIQLTTKPPEQFQDGWETSYLDELFSSYRFIYSSRHIGFKSIYRELLLPTSGLGTLHENSKIVLLTDGMTPPLPLLDKSKLNKHNPDISQASQADIATVRQNKELNNDVLHWLKLNDECLIACEEEFENLNAIDNEPEIIDLLKTKYTPYLVIEE